MTGTPIHQVNHFTILAHMQFLSENGFSPANNANHLAGLRAKFIIHALPTACLRHETIQWMHKSLKLHSPFTPRRTCLIDIDTLKKLVELANEFPHTEVFQTLFLFAFFCMWELISRIS